MAEVRVHAFSISGINASELGYQAAEHVPTAGATHAVLTKRS